MRRTVRADSYSSPPSASPYLFSLYPEEIQHGCSFRYEGMYCDSAHNGAITLNPVMGGSLDTGHSPYTSQSYLQYIRDGGWPDEWRANYGGVAMHRYFGIHIMGTAKVESGKSYLKWGCTIERLHFQSDSDLGKCWAYGFCRVSEFTNTTDMAKFLFQNESRKGISCFSELQVFLDGEA